MNKIEKLKLMDSPSEGSNNLNLERDFFWQFWVELCWHKSANHLEIRAADKIHTGVLSQLKIERVFTNSSQIYNDYFHISVYPWINYSLSEWYVGIKKFRLHMIVLSIGLIQMPNGCQHMISRWICIRHFTSKPLQLMPAIPAITLISYPYRFSSIQLHVMQIYFESVKLYKSKLWCQIIYYI